MTQNTMSPQIKHNLCTTYNIYLLLCIIVLSGCAPSINSPDPLERSKAVDRITDQNVLARLAMEDEDIVVRQGAVHRLTDQNVLAKVVMDDKQHRYVREAAVKNLTSQEELMRLVQHKPRHNVHYIFAELVDRICKHPLG